MFKGLITWDDIWYIVMAVLFSIMGIALLIGGSIEIISGGDRFHGACCIGIFLLVFFFDVVVYARTLSNMRDQKRLRNL